MAQFFIGNIFRAGAAIPDATVIPLNPPAPPGLGAFGGFSLKLQDRRGGTPLELANVANDFIAAAKKRPEIGSIRSGLNPNTPPRRCGQLLRRHCRKAMATSGRGCRCRSSSRSTAATQRDYLRLVKLLAQHGVQSAVEVRQAETQLLTTENQIPAVELQIAQTEDALAILLGKAPRSFDVEAELPLVTSRGETTHAIAAAVGVPIFQGGALVANYKSARAQAEQAALQYRRTVLASLQEVSDALVAYDRDGAEAGNNRNRVAVGREYLRLADLRFRSGVISYLEVLDAQRQLFSAQLDLNTSEVNQRLAAVQLYKALGGGWNPAEPTASR